MTQVRTARVGVDVGGTFTDLVLVDDATGRTRVEKLLTTPADPAAAVLEGLARLVDQPAAVRNVVHGTTLATNAIIERKGVRTALLTTAGARDQLEIGKEHRYDLYDLFLEKPAPLVPRHLRFEVRERLLADGTVDTPLDEAGVVATISELLRLGVEAAAVCLLHSYRFPDHERRVGALLREHAPEIDVSLSSEVAPEIREYERASTTVCNAYVRKLVAGYVARLEAGLERSGIGGRLFLMLSSGGIGSPEVAARVPVRLLESGPAAGALAAAAFGRASGHPDLLAFDMGGTTAKLCLIEGGEPLVAREFEVARVYRFKKGSGLPVRIPVVDLIEIGAGGGSIARVDGLGLLKVGPESAGADPGPACYARGGTLPTVTDADCVLGFLDPGFFLGGAMLLDAGAARAAIAAHVAAPLGLDVVEAAWGIHRVVNEAMAAAARIHAVERGKDPQAYPLFAFGGAGPVHAARVAEVLGVTRVLCPLGAGAASALGLCCAPLAFDLVRSYYSRLDDLDWAAVEALLRALEAEGRALVSAAGVPADALSVRRIADLRYVGQGFEIEVPLPSGPLGPGSLAELRAAFDREYRRLYHRDVPDLPLEALSWRVVVAAPPPGLPSIWGSGRAEAPAGDAAGALKGRRPVYLPEARGFVEVPVYDRYRLAPGSRFEGPAVVEERESTAVVPPGWGAEVDPWWNLVLQRRPEGARWPGGVRRGRPV